MTWHGAIWYGSQNDPYSVAHEVELVDLIGLFLWNAAVEKSSGFRLWVLHAQVAAVAIQEKEAETSQESEMAHRIPSGLVLAPSLCSHLCYWQYEFGPELEEVVQKAISAHHQT